MERKSLISENIKKVYKNTILCLKYPFLYQRNRYTDEHYRNLWIHNRLWDIRKNYLLHFSINFLTLKDYEKRCKQNDQTAITLIGKSINFNDNSIILIKDVENFKLIVNGKVYLYKISDYLDRTDLTSKDVEDIVLVTRTSTIFTGEKVYKTSIWFLLNKEDKRYFTFKSISVYTKSIKKYETYLLNKINDFLKIFHILPSSSELDAMEDGWRNKFGEDICREIRNSLLTTYIRNENPTNIFSKIKCYYKGIKHLYSYRILQIKEKFGGLRWYAFGDTKDTSNIIHKYEGISERTCIVCGKDAKYMSTGWISPFCEEHKPERYTEIK